MDDVSRKSRKPVGDMDVNVVTSGAARSEEPGAHSEEIEINADEENREL